MRRWKKGLGSDMPVFLMVAESVMNPFPLRQNYDNLKLALHIERKNALSHFRLSWKTPIRCF